MQIISIKTFLKLFEIGSFYKWNSSKEIALIIEDTEGNEKSLIYLTKIYKNIDKNLYRTFDYANFLRGHDKFSESITLYSEILSEINKDHKMYPRVLDRRGTAYERNGEWTLAEKDLLLSLEIDPNQAYTLNYLAYTWIEQNRKTEKALSMLEKADNLKKNDGYITDSLGWAQYKLKNFSEAKFYLERAIQMMPDDPIVNDHFADCLWMIDKKIQARYYWEYVLTLEDTEDELREKVKNTLINMYTSGELKVTNEATLKKLVGAIQMTSYCGHDGFTHAMFVNDDREKGNPDKRSLIIKTYKDDLNQTFLNIFSAFQNNPVDCPLSIDKQNKGVQIIFTG